MLDLRQLRYFVAIVDAGSVSRAALVLHIAQPAMSQQLAHLEREIGTKLLRRSVRGVAPTDAGKAVYRHAQTLLKLAAETANVARGAGAGASGRVRIGLPSSIAMILGSASGCVTRAPSGYPCGALRKPQHLPGGATLRRARRFECSGRPFPIPELDHGAPGVRIHLF